MHDLAKLERVENLRLVWEHEAVDFTRWLAKEENLALLSEALKINILLEERESSVGGFNVDIYAKEAGSERKVIIENQLEVTDHIHLGQLITYASGKDANIIIWIVKRARDEHRQAIEWLNQNTNESIGFFLLEIELWKIGNSKLAPKFNIVVRPNDWAKGEKTKEGLSEIKKLQFEYWQQFSSYAFDNNEFSREFTQRKVSAQHWYDIGAGNSTYHICFTVNTQKKRIGTDIYIDDDKLFYEKVKKYKNDIEQELQIKLDWVAASKACRIIAYKQEDVKNNLESWEACFEWQMNTALKLNKLMKKYSRLNDD